MPAVDSALGEWEHARPKTYAGNVSGRDLREPFWAERQSRV